jgi:hypothetical protein
MNLNSAYRLESAAMYTAKGSSEILSSSTFDTQNFVDTLHCCSWCLYIVGGAAEHWECLGIQSHIPVNIQKQVAIALNFC